MNEADFVELADHVVPRLLDRLPEADRIRIGDYLNAGEWALLTDELLATLLEEQTPLSRWEYEQIEKMSYYFETPLSYFETVNNRENVLPALNVADSHDDAAR